MLASAYGNAPNSKPGYGIQRTSTIFSATVRPYILAILRVYNTADEKLLAWQWAFDSIMGKPNFIGKEELPWKENFDFNPSEKEIIQKSVKSHIKEGLQYSLSALSLVGN